MSATYTPSAIDRYAAQLAVQGWCVLHDVVPLDVARQTRSSLYGIGISCGVIAQSYTNNITPIPFYTRVSVVKDTALFAPYLASGAAADVVRLSLGKSICVTATTMLIHEPSTERGPWHVGEPFDETSVMPTGGAAQHLMAVLMYSPFTRENGGIAVVPASHRETAPAKDSKPSCEPVTITGRLGSVAILDGRLWRAVAANDSDVPRVSVVAGFAPASGDVTGRPRANASVISAGALNRLDERVRPLVEHWVSR